ncbi:MAG: hypothetical protein AUG51_16100 [Acidobacteria bacterium 13_1_20CM_3_53_8]|nr:MAG: hypothetical protein AUG51_16100 [Acidobacteria bacterium 13_1_20CM_3_53_8]
MRVWLGSQRLIPLHLTDHQLTLILQAMHSIRAPGQCSDDEGYLIESRMSSSASTCPTWAQDINDFARQLPAADLALLDKHIRSEPLTTDMLLKSTWCCVETYKQKRFQRALRKLDPLFSHIKSFSSIVDVFVQTNPMIPGLIWGSLHLAITVGFRN